MASKPAKFYVVWSGHRPGIYRTWAEAEPQIKGFAGARHKSFASLAEAEAAFAQPGLAAKAGSSASRPGAARSATKTQAKAKATDYPKGEAFCVDAAWNSVGKAMEYQGVWLSSGELVFHRGPFADGTNNIGEFLAVVHALAFLQAEHPQMPIYTDSRTAMAWVKKTKANSQSLKEGRIDPKLVELIARAEHWLQSNRWQNPIVKWQTKAWGEIPADFGRK